MTSKKVLLVAAITATLAAAVALYLYNPSETALYPKCPFFVLTGYKCPGCGTLRGLHALLHGRIIEAIHFNLFMVISIPILILLTFFKKVRSSVIFPRIILAGILIWWIVRNTPLFA